MAVFLLYRITRTKLSDFLNRKQYLCLLFCTSVIEVCQLVLLLVGIKFGGEEKDQHAGDIIISVTNPGHYST